MVKEDVRIQYRGVHPNEETKDYLKVIVSEIYEEAPYGSTVKAQFANEKNKVKASLHVHSKGIRFFISSSATNMKELGHNLLIQARRRIEKWKNNRFKRGLTRLEIDSHLDHKQEVV